MACGILGVSTSGWQKNYKSAYRNLCKKYHPDNNGQTDIYVRITEAYDYLTEAEKRMPGNKETSRVFTGRVYGMPTSSSDREAAERKLERQRRENAAKRKEEIYRKAHEIRQKEKEDRIINEIRWIRIADIIKRTIEEDSKRSELEKSMKNAIKRHNENNRQN